VTTTTRDWLSSAGEKVSRRAELRPLLESRSSSKKPPGRSAEKMWAGRLARRKHTESLCRVGGISTSGGKKSHGEIQAETGTAGKKSKRKNEGRTGEIGPAGGSQTPNTEPTLPVHTSCTVLGAPVLCTLMTARGYDFKKKQNSDLAGNRPQKQDIPVRRGN
jgi:hypothetical protein